MGASGTEVGWGGGAHRAFDSARRDVGAQAPGDGHSGSVELRLRQTPTGWQAQVTAGSFPATGMQLELEGELVRYSWTVVPNLDPLDDGVRSRLAFDMASDLVRLSPPGASGQKV